MMSSRKKADVASLQAAFVGHYVPVESGDDVKYRNCLVRAAVV
jgi:hypothetical protein